MGSWIESKLGDVIELKRGYDLPKAKRKPGVVPIVSSSGVSDYHREAKVAGPGVVTGRYGTLGEVFFVRDDYWPLNTTLYVKDFKGNDPRFISYLLRTVDFLAYSDKAAVPGVNRNHLHEARVQVPAQLAEQQAIGAVLGALDDKIDLNGRMNETLEAMARAIFKDWFVDFGPTRAKAEGRAPYLSAELWDLFPNALDDDDKPAGWGKTSLGGLCEKPQYGFTASAQDENTGVKFLRITDINKRPWVQWEGVPFCEVSSQDESKYILRDGDLLIARMADPGHGVLVESPPRAVFASYLIRFVPSAKWIGRYLQYWLRSDAYWMLVRARQVGTTRSSLNARALSEFPVVVPDQSIGEAFLGVARAVREHIVANAEETWTLAEMRDLLLPKLMSGEIRVKDAEAEVEAVA